ncbi:MAG: sigma-70 family RNA polymerase sigma factor, partial [Pseudomonadales bacterium]|nr:sigma-70 family RNA polymerase sigma factor [Pseudomonadales bacterium]
NFKVTHIDDQESLVDESGRTSPEQELSQVQSNRDIVNLLAGLSAEQRQVVELKFFQHFTFDEIGSQLGISVNTAKTRLYAALGKMRQRDDQNALCAGDLS